MKHLYCGIMWFCKQFCCFKICQCKDEDNADEADQEEPLPEVIVTQPRLTSPTSSERGIDTELSTILQDTRANSANSDNFFTCYTTDTSGEDTQHKNVTTRNLQSRIPSISGTLDSQWNWKPTISSEFPTEDPWVRKSSTASSILDQSPLDRDKSIIKPLKPQVHDFSIISSPRDSITAEIKNDSFTSDTRDTSREDTQHKNGTTRNSHSRIPSISGTLDSQWNWKPTISSEFPTEDPWVRKSSTASSILDQSPLDRDKSIIKPLKPQVHDFSIISSPRDSITAEIKNDSFTSDTRDTSREDTQHKNGTTRNSHSRIPSISGTLDSQWNWKPTISSEFPTEDPWVRKSSTASSILDQSPLDRDKSIIKPLKPQVHDSSIISSPRDSITAEVQKVSTILMDLKEKKDKKLTYPTSPHLSTSTIPVEASNPFPKLRTVASAEHFPLAVPSKPKSTGASTTLKPTLPYLSALTTNVKPSVQLPQSQSQHPATPIKSLIPLNSHTEMSPLLILSPSALLREQQLQHSHLLLRSTPNEDLLTNLLRSFKMHHAPVLPKAREYQVELLDPKSENFVYNVLFRNRKFKDFYEISAVKRIWNPYLALHYELNRIKYGSKFKHRFMYHGTSLFAAHQIFKHNFNWRMVKEFNYGKGVYFANNPYFASHYGKRSANSGMKNYIMIVAKVLIEEGDIQRGSPHLVPPAGHSTVSESQQEFIKFDDCAFYPEFLVVYRPISEQA